MDRPVAFDFIARDKNYSSGLQRMERHTVRFGATVGRIGGVGLRAFGGLGLAIGGVAAAGATLGIKTAANLETAQIAFKHLTGSAAAGKKTMAELIRFAAVTPFELPGVQTAAVQLLGAGENAKKLIPDLTAIGDAASTAANPADAFGRTVLALSQAMNLGKLQGQDLLQITEAGIPIWQELAKATGKPVPVLQKLSSQGKLLTADVLPKLFVQLHKDYGGAMEEQSRTLTGVWSTFKDTVSQSLAQVMTPLADMLKKTLPEAGKVIGDFVNDKLIPAMKTLKKWWDDNKDAVSALASILGDVFTTSASDADVSVGDLSKSLGGLAGILDRIMWAALQTTKDFIQLARFVGNLELRILDLVAAAGHALKAIGFFDPTARKAGQAMIDWAGDMKDKTRVQLGHLAEDSRRTQAQIDKMHDKTIDIKGRDLVGPVARRIKRELASMTGVLPGQVLKVDVRTGRSAAGGLILGPGGPTADKAGVFALSNREFVQPAVATDYYGVPFMEAIRKRQLPRMAAGGVVDEVSALPALRSRMLAFGRQQLAAIPSLGGGAGSALAMKVAQWTVAALHRSMGEVAGWFRRLMFESGGNPRAINRSDSNWFAGHPSIGIAQVIRGTFAANAGRYRGVGPFAYGVSMNPFANSYAGGHYAIGRYGSLAAVDPRVRPIGYDRGGFLPPGLSLAYNGTGRPERVGGGITVHVHVAGSVIAEHDLADTVQKALLAKQHRLGGISLGLS
jgi:tape measure domain-containing protein